MLFQFFFSKTKQLITLKLSRILKFFHSFWIIKSIVLYAFSVTLLSFSQWDTRNRLAETQFGWRTLIWPFSFFCLPAGLSTSTPLFPHTLKSTPLESLGVSCSFEFQVHPSDSNILSQIIHGTLISSICKLTVRYTLSMLMDMSLELPFISVLIRKNTLGLLSLGLHRVFPQLMQESSIFKLSLFLPQYFFSIKAKASRSSFLKTSWKRAARMFDRCTCGKIQACCFTESWVLNLLSHRHHIIRSGYISMHTGRLTHWYCIFP